MNKAVELIIRAYIISFNETLDRHVRPLIYDEVISDPRHGMIPAAIAGIGALRNLPTETFESGEQMIHFIRVIDNIGKAIALGK